MALVFNNQTMRRANQPKPHIARVGGYWRVSPWKFGMRDYYSRAHAWVTKRNIAERAGVAN